MKISNWKQLDMRTKYEIVLLGVITAILLAFLVNSFLFARTAVRDDLRREDITNLKRAAELYNNKFGYYPTPPSKLTECTSSDPSSWLLGENSPLVEDHFINAIPHDVRESKGHVYSYCVTNIEDGRAMDYYFEAELEITEDEERAFDEDESRKFDYRILHEDGKVLYRVCGGNEEQCKST